VVERDFLVHITMSLVEELQGHFIGPFLNMTIPEMAETMLHVMILLLPFIFYTIAWHWPSIWCVFAENLGFRPSILFAYVAYIMKLLQFSVWDLLAEAACHLSWPCLST
jgi:hypothetical protein